jgi:hypothetical protein
MGFLAAPRKDPRLAKVGLPVAGMQVGLRLAELLPRRLVASEARPPGMYAKSHAVEPPSPSPWLGHSSYRSGYSTTWRSA